MSNIYIKGAVGVVAVVLFSIAYTYVEERWPKTVSQSSKSSKGKGKGKGKLSLNVEKTVERAAIAAKNMEFERAAKLANRVLERDPDNWQSWLILGGALRSDAPGGAGGRMPAARTRGTASRIESLEMSPSAASAASRVPAPPLAAPLVSATPDDGASRSSASSSPCPPPRFSRAAGFREASA